MTNKIFEMTGISRIVVLGASNLARGFPTVVSTARSVWGPEIRILAALGHGRSYGAPSRVLFRTLPGILESGLWKMLKSLPAGQTRAFVTDVGNDIVYGYAAGQILDWIGEAVRRLQQSTQDITITGLPLFSIRRLSRAKFSFFRKILFPACRLSREQVIDAAEKVNAGLEDLAKVRGLRFFQLNPNWYGFDPIHIRPSSGKQAWQEILGVSSAGSHCRLLESSRIRMMAPERRRLFGVERFTPQNGIPFRIWRY
jgi:hypothetical protein